MKATGVVRCVDDLGRIVIQKENGRTLREGDLLIILTVSDGYLWAMGMLVKRLGHGYLQEQALFMIMNLLCTIWQNVGQVKSAGSQESQPIIMDLSCYAWG